MDSNFQEVRQIQLPPPNVNQYETTPNIACIAFDTDQELLWVGNDHGRVTSYYGQQLEKYTSLQAHSNGKGPVEQFLFNEIMVLSLASQSVHSLNRRGLTYWHIEQAAMTKLCCMSFLRKDSPIILVAGCQRIMYKIDVDKGQAIEEIPTNAEYTMMKLSRYICAATSTGSVDLFDPATLQIVKTWQAHTSKINSMDAKTDYLVTCGWSHRQYGPPLLDHLAKVYDLRRLEQLAPISFPSGAAYVQIHPKMSTTSLLASQLGHLQIVDLVSSENVAILHAHLPNVMTLMIIAPSGNVWAIVDQDNGIHLWGSPEKLQFAEGFKPTEFADNVRQVPRISVDEDVPFNTIGMPYYREKLLSAWGNDRVFEVGNPPAALDIGILKHLRPNPAGAGHIAPNPRKILRNQVSAVKSMDPNGIASTGPKLLSERARDSKVTSNGRRESDGAEAMLNMKLADNTKADVPSHYAHLGIKGSSFGIEDFDFRYYNKTRYSGLANHIANSYLNPLLQLLRFTPLVRNLALQHVAGNCLQDGCLLCEMGFFFDMLEKANGKWCQAVNFLKTYSNIPEAAELNTVEEISSRNTLHARISAANQFLLHQICQDSKRMSSPNASLDQILVTNGLLTFRCLNCHLETFRGDASHVITLCYPDRYRGNILRFSDALSLGFQNESQTKGYCSRCKRWPPMASRRTITEVSPVLTINTDLEKYAKHKQLWTNPGWLPQEIGIAIEGGNMICLEGDQLHAFRHYRSTIIFELVGLVADIASGERQKSHLVSFVNVAISERSPQEQNQWYLFNDFLVGKINQDEALTATPWKTPVILTYQVQHARHNIDDSWRDSIDIRCLYLNGSLNSAMTPIAYTLKPQLEIPGPGTFVAIDAEFVLLVKEEIEITADGDRHVIKPVRRGLGRVSVLRVNGPDDGIPFIDDYITIHEPIGDYLTKWSGLQEQDLDPRRSSHALVSLKVAYKKLWLLLNLGCVFIGHGLINDFREANIHVPSPQVIDTSDLYLHKERKSSRLKLSFLTEFFLKEKIQTGNHDSIEDARSALHLWRKYQEFQEKGVVEQKLEEMYREGRKTNYGRDGGMVVKGHGKSGRVKGGSSVDAGLLGGRVTPDLGGGSGVDIVVGTPRGRREGETYFESPLR